MRKIKLILLSALILVGCSTKHPHLETAPKVDLDRYLGKWYEIARFEHFFEEGCKSVTAKYSLRDDGKIAVVNRCIMIEDGKEKKAKAVAYSTNESNTKLKVSFFRPFYGDYWILDLADDYSYALVGTPNREYLWILSRSKEMDQKTKERLIQKSQSLGFNTSDIVWTIHD